jgi:hypothetical protein
MAALVNPHASGNGIHHFLNACRSIQKNIQLMVKEIKEYKTPGGVRIRLYPIIGTLSLPSEVDHAFNIWKQVVQPNIPIKEFFSHFPASRAMISARRGYPQAH